MIASYSLSEHVHLCRIEGHILLLDVLQDKYLALPAAATECLADLVPGWPAAIVPGQQDARRSGSAEALARELTSKGILANGAGKPATPISVVPTLADLDSQQSSAARGDLGAAASLSILRCLATAALITRRYSLQQLVQRDAARKDVHRCVAPPFDLALARRLVASFRRLQPYIYASRNACLFESVALLELMARWHMYPDWIFGVRLGPFAAHCWLQHEGIVVSDTRAHVDLFRPIMIV